MLRAIGHEAFNASSLGYLAELWRDAGDAERAEEAIAEALLLAEKTGERLHLPELLRIQAALVLAGSPVDAAAALDAAVELASRQGAWLIALRAAVAISELPEEVRRIDWRTVLEEALSHLPAGSSLPEVVRAGALLDS
jgi:predicted ATPase